MIFASRQEGPFAPPLRRLLPALLVLGWAGHLDAASTLIVDATFGSDNGASPFASIQAALDAADPQATILVEPGTYDGPLLIDTSGIHLRASSLLGPKPVIQASDPTGATGTVTLAAGTNGVTIRGFAISGIDGPPETPKAAIFLQGPNDSVLILGNTITAAGDAAILSASSGAVSNLVIDGNLIDGVTFTGAVTGGPGGDGEFTEPNWPRALVSISGAVPAHSNITFRNNTVSATTGDANNSSPMVYLETAGALITGNTFNGDTGSRPGVPILQVSGTDAVVSNNQFLAVSDTAVQVGGGAFDTAASSEVAENSFIAVYSQAVANYAGSVLTATHNYWGGDGTLTGSGPFAPNSGVSGSVDFSPWYADAARTQLVNGILENTTIAEGDTASLSNAYIIPGVAVTVRGTLQVAGEFIMGENAVLDVVGGDLVLNGSTLKGAFTFFNSFGSVHFNDNTSITGSVSGLVLVSDVHVADGAVITLDGTLVMDGSLVTTPGSFDFVVNPGARFTMARSVFSGGDIQIRSGDTRIYDNQFMGASVLVFPSASGAAIYHNITDNPAWLTDAGSGTVTLVDGWGNVTDPADTLNNLLLDLDVSALPYRTRDSLGNIFVQPGDTFVSEVWMTDLQQKMAGVEILLGYSTDYLNAFALDLLPDWDNPIVQLDDSATIIGKLDAALGLSFDFPDPDGTDADQALTHVLLMAETLEGQTRFFHRVKLASDLFGGETRLTTGGPTPEYRIPFTMNSAIITIDGTQPVINTDPLNIQVLQDGIDMTLTGNVAVAGILDVSFSAMDELSGINEPETAVLLVEQANPANTISGVVLASSPSALPGYTEFQGEILIDSVVPNGPYDVVARVRDRSGNETATTIGVVEIETYQMSIEVQLQGLVPGPLTRDVTFVLSDSIGTIIETRTEPVTFTSGTGSVVLPGVAGTTAYISAKTAWNLRKRLEVGFDAAGHGIASFTGSNQLRGGDLTGSNTVGTIDYAILRNNFNQAGAAAQQADITGSGTVGTIDYAILRANFNTAGDPQ